MKDKLIYIAQVCFKGLQYLFLINHFQPPLWLTGKGQLGLDLLRQQKIQDLSDIFISFSFFLVYLTF